MIITIYTIFKNMEFIGCEGEQQSNIFHKFVGYALKILVF